MKNIKKYHLLWILTVSLLLSPLQAFSQTKAVKPRSEKLLNGMRVLLFNNNSDNNVDVILRVHSGSAYDPLNKEGVMKLLADSIFPNQEVFDFFKEDLGGELTVTTNYEYIEFRAKGPADKLVDMLQTISSQIINPTIDKEVTAKIKDTLIADLSNKNKDLNYVADNAVAKQLLGDYPYGRPQIGDVESVNKIDFADLIFAKNRFFLADNATIAISGRFDAGLTLRALRRVFGAWQKSDKLSPFTFKQADEADTKVKHIEITTSNVIKVRYATRGIARNSTEYPSYRVLAEILELRAKKQFPTSFVHTESNRLAGLLMIGYDETVVDGKVLEVKELLDDIADGVADAEFNDAKQKALAERNARSLAEQWLDVETFGIKTYADDNALFMNVSKADVSRLAANMAKNAIVNVRVGKTVDAPTN